VVTGLVLFGGLARGRFVPHQSDVNLVVLVRDGSVATLAAVAPPLRAAYRSIRVEPLVITFDEVARSADVFPTKFLDIVAHHVVLAGQSPFGALEIPKDHLRLRVEQELRNASLRARRRALAALGNAEALEGSLDVERAVGLQALRQPPPIAERPVESEQRSWGDVLREALGEASSDTTKRAGATPALPPAPACD
jgi:hypothetical protein